MAKSLQLLIGVFLILCNRIYAASTVRHIYNYSDSVVSVTFWGEDDYSKEWEGNAYVTCPSLSVTNKNGETKIQPGEVCEVKYTRGSGIRSGSGWTIWYTLIRVETINPAGSSRYCVALKSTETDPTILHNGSTNGVILNEPASSDIIFYSSSLPPSGTYDSVTNDQWREWIPDCYINGN